MNSTSSITMDIDWCYCGLQLPERRRDGPYPSHCNRACYERERLAVNGGALDDFESSSTASTSSRVEDFDFPCVPHHHHRAPLPARRPTTQAQSPLSRSSQPTTTQWPGNDSAGISRWAASIPPNCGPSPTSRGADALTRVPIAVALPFSVAQHAYSRARAAPPALTRTTTTTTTIITAAGPSSSSSVRRPSSSTTTITTTNTTGMHADRTPTMSVMRASAPALLSNANAQSSSGGDALSLSPTASPSARLHLPSETTIRHEPPRSSVADRLKAVLRPSSSSLHPTEGSRADFDEATLGVGLGMGPTKIMVTTEHTTTTTTTPNFQQRGFADEDLMGWELAGANDNNNVTEGGSSNKKKSAASLFPASSLAIAVPRSKDQVIPAHNSASKYNCGFGYGYWTANDEPAVGGGGGASSSSSASSSEEEEGVEGSGLVIVARARAERARAAERTAAEERRGRARGVRGARA